ncbi:hypothetical protein F4819DRAFT_461209 [Hypoxylon fuscum]|nr:hypothetical protein F4819DRAFT_461209 [Hypoxylon fuscum]
MDNIFYNLPFLVQFILARRPLPDHVWSENYEGSRSARNCSENIEDGENCAVWIQGLPPDCNHTMLCGALRATGKLYAVVINPPVDCYKTCAAKVVFWDRKGVSRLAEKVNSGKFIVSNHRPRMTANRIKTSAQPPSSNSRVIDIRGPSSIVNFPFLNSFLRTHFFFDLEGVEVLENNGYETCMRWSFGSYRSQSEFAMYRIRSQQHRENQGSLEGLLWSHVSVKWVPDPCA